MKIFYLFLILSTFCSCSKTILEYHYITDQKLSEQGVLYEDQNLIIIRPNQVVIQNERGEVRFAIDNFQEGYFDFSTETHILMHTYYQHPENINQFYEMRIIELSNYEVWIHVLNPDKQQLMNVKEELVMKVRRPRKELIDY